MPFCSRPLGAALSIAAIATAATVSPGHAQQDPGAGPPAAPPPQAAPEAKPPDGPPPSPLPPRTRPAGSAVVSARVNMRSGPGTDSEIVTTIPAGSAVRVTGCDGEWCAVTWNGQSGYAIARNLDLGASRQARVYPAPQPGQPGPGYPADYDLPGYGPGYYGPPVAYGPAYYYGPRVYYYGRPWGWRRYRW